MKIDFSKLKLRSKKDSIPGTVEEGEATICKSCLTKAVVVLKPCCGEPLGALLCQNCGYRVRISG